MFVNVYLVVIFSIDTLDYKPSILYLEALVEESGVLLHLAGRGEIDMLHFGVLVTDADDEAADDVRVDAAANLDVATANNRGHGVTDLLLLGFAELDGARHVHWGKTGLGLHDSRVHLGDFSRQVQSVVLSQYREQVDHEWRHLLRLGDVAEDGQLLGRVDKWVAHVVADLVVVEGSLQSRQVLGHGILDALLVGSAVYGLRVIARDSENWNWGGLSRGRAGESADD